jgi:hypothetical protein
MVMVENQTVPSMLQYIPQRQLIRKRTPKWNYILATRMLTSSEQGAETNGILESKIVWGKEHRTFSKLSH